MLKRFFVGMVTFVLVWICMHFIAYVGNFSRDWLMLWGAWAYILASVFSEVMEERITVKEEK